MAECPNLKTNLESCTCTYSSCSKRGKCCECVAYHRAMRQLPGCFFSPAMERTYDRSYEAFCRDQGR